MLLIEAIFFISPCYVSNSFASLSRSLPFLKKWSTPIDFGKSYNGRRVLGDGKTFRGLISGTIVGSLMGFIQFYLSQNYNFTYIPEFNNFNLLNFLTLGFLLSLGALLGDIIKSLIKRRFGIKRGRPWPPFDQLDFILGGFLLSILYFFPGWNIALVIIVITPLIHFCTNVIAYWLKIKDVWW